MRRKCLFLAMLEPIQKMLTLCGIEMMVDGTPHDQDIPRELLLRQDVYRKVQELVPDMKSIMSSSYLTSLQSNAMTSQKWPLINIVRQLLKQTGYRMHPIRKSDGYTAEGKKKYRRFFRIEKYKMSSASVPDNNEESSLATL